MEKKKGYAEVDDYQMITENNHIIADFQTDNLMDKILHKDNLNKAYKKVKSNKGAGGVGGIKVDELLTYLKENQKQLIQKVKDGKYKPNPVRRVEIPKEEKGKVRKLGIPTVVDTVCQSKLIEILSRTIKDGRVVSLIHKYLNVGVIQNGIFERTEIGVPQGEPLSPLLSNIMLNELDKELEKRGHRFVRYADDCMIFCKSKKSAERTLNNIIPFIEGKLYLKVNQDKTVVEQISKVKYLGYTFYKNKGKCRFRVHPKSIKKMKDKIRELTIKK